ncbi:hypothetical protein BDR05DRAFT_992072 [Suillus weaverae]|nr:hypothetical protein BDR05DRAFT_992072 [Suillus weaverae]
MHQENRGVYDCYDSFDNSGGALPIQIDRQTLIEAQLRSTGILSPLVDTLQTRKWPGNEIFKCLANASESRVLGLGLDLGLDRSFAHDIVTASSKGHDLETNILERATFPRVLFRDSAVNVPFGLQPSPSDRYRPSYMSHCQVGIQETPNKSRGERMTEKLTCLNAKHKTLSGMPH